MIERVVIINNGDEKRKEQLEIHGQCREQLVAQVETKCIQW